ncbi:sugar phosphate isomerase/epimerase [Dinghuibacter silviterrae]|uniref:Sugar phosphate isomerase/epimerase n=2 Tax=Dinghuibacter silviterrae TaxID=1539049 RepID=A0A4V3GL00_9BACT|nr:sugar phosphate isomerase/epimerase [Dinghuibacter silviterrae]
MAGVAVAPLLPHTRVCLQLYSVRDAMKADPTGTLKQLAAMGYRNVEHANYIDRKFYGFDAVSFRKILSDLGLAMVSGHTELKEGVHWSGSDFTDAWKHTLEDAKTAGQEYVVCPWLDESLRGDYDRLQRWMAVFNKCGALCKTMGLQFGYHNHDFEFKDHLNGKLLFDIILSETDPSLVAQQLDIGNLLLGGAKPMDVLQAHPGRFALLHVKDMIPAHGTGEMGGAYESTILGQGILDTRSVVTRAVRQGATQLTIEQESYQGRNPLDDARNDLTTMHRWGF